MKLRLIVAVIFCSTVSAVPAFAGNASIAELGSFAGGVQKSNFTPHQSGDVFAASDRPAIILNGIMAPYPTLTPFISVTPSGNLSVYKVDNNLGLMFTFNRTAGTSYSIILKQGFPLANGDTLPHDFTYVINTIVPSQATITLPVEVLGAANTTQAVLVQLTSLPAGGVKTLSLRTHGLNYQTEGSVQINAGAWISLNNANTSIKVLGSALEYGGIGGAFTVLDLQLSLQGGEFVAGKNVINFRFNGTDGRTEGYRVLKLNLLDSNANASLPPNTFVQDNPNNWVAPLNNSADIQAGKNLWMSATLNESPINTSHTLLAHCTDCHTQDGRDLKYFNYSNTSIIQRAMFHGLSHVQGQQIASFIRTLNVPNPGRPWNPPYQPTPGLDSLPISDWSAGGGIDAVLPNDAALQAYLPGQGKSVAALMDQATSGVTFKKVNMREIPMSIPYLDWNHWLPLVSPMDLMGSVTAFHNHPGYSIYDQIRSQLAATAPALNSAFISDQAVHTGFIGLTQDWYLARRALDQAVIAANGGEGANSAAVAAYQASVWTATKMWEIQHEFNLEGVGQSLYGINGDSRSWVNSNRFIFDVSPHTTANEAKVKFTNVQMIGDSNIGNHCTVTHGNPKGSCVYVVQKYLARVWYDIQMSLNSGSKHALYGGHSTIDWGYMSNFEADTIDTFNRMEPMDEARLLMKSYDEHDTGIDQIQIWWGWGYRDQNNGTFLKSATTGIQDDWASSPGNTSVLTTMYQAWLEKSVKNIPMSNWISVLGSHFDGENFPPASYIIGSASFPPGAVGGQIGDNLVRSFTDQWSSELIALKNVDHINSAILNGASTFAQTLWPLNDWSVYRGTAANLASPQASVSGQGVEQILLSWPAIGGATSYNVKRSDQASGNFQTVAYFVSGTQFTDHVFPGIQYFYKVSANASADAQEGPDSATVSGIASTGLVSDWKIPAGPIAPGTVIADSGMGEGNPLTAFNSLSGLTFFSAPTNLSKWLGKTATLTAWVQLPIGFAGSNSITNAPAIVGGNAVGFGASAWGSLDVQGKIRALSFYCTGDNTNYSPIKSTTAINDGSPHFIAVSRDMISGQIALYVDGQLSSSGPGGKGECTNITRSIGQQDGERGNVLPGLFKEIRIYDKVLTPTQVAAVYAQ